VLARAFVQNCTSALEKFHFTGHLEANGAILDVNRRFYLSHRCSVAWDSI